jgi:hypothetical protein
MRKYDQIPTKCEPSDILKIGEIQGYDLVNTYTKVSDHLNSLNGEIVSYSRDSQNVISRDYFKGMLLSNIVCKNRYVGYGCMNHVSFLQEIVYWVKYFSVRGIEQGKIIWEQLKEWTLKFNENHAPYLYEKGKSISSQILNRMISWLQTDGVQLFDYVKENVYVITEKMWNSIPSGETYVS